jgi:Tol biopolymer transport system component
MKKQLSVGLLFLPVFLLVLSSFISPTPRFDFTAKFLEANKLMEEKLWTQSINAWREILANDPNNANINYKLGYCLLQSANSKSDALQYLETASAKKFTKNYDPYDSKEKRAPVDVLFYLGKAQALNLQLDNAAESFKKLQSSLNKKHFLHNEAVRELEMVAEAKRQMANPQNYIITNVGPVVNGETNDFGPVLSLDESTLFFTSRRMRPDSSNSSILDFYTGEYKEDVYVSFKNEEGVWTDPEILNLNSDAHDATIGVSPDGQTLFIYRDNYGDGQVMESKLIGETWSEPVLLGSDINSSAWETHATISADGNILFFVSDREGGVGKRDIYRCVKLPNGEWSKALNIGNSINTKYDEDAPFVTPDGKTLYFASKGHNSMGGFDIFYSNLGEDGEWSTPLNMGYPLNTVDDDVFFVPMADGRRAYYSSARDGGYGLKDIYLVDMPDVTNENQMAVLKGFIIAPEGDELPNDLRILVTNNKSGEVTEYKPRKRDGGYLAILAPCTSYHIEYMKGNDKIKDDDINVPCESSFQEIEREVFLVPVAMIPAEKPAPVVEEPIVSTEKPSEFGYDPKSPINREYIESLHFAQFSRYFVYDFHQFGVEERQFTAFIADVKKIIDLGKKPEITVESSASTVPSSKYKTNQELAAWRNKTARNQVIEELAKYGLKENVDYTFAPPVELVQGKKYEKDAQKNRLIYEQYQYIKIKAQG